MNQLYALCKRVLAASCTNKAEYPSALFVILTQAVYCFFTNSGRRTSAPRNTLSGFRN